MLQVSNGLVLQPSSALTGQLPTCGAQGVKPDDFVTFAALSGPFVGWRLVPVSASRIGVVQPFFDSIGRSPPFKDPGRGPVGTVFTVRCRSAPTSAPSSQEPLDPLLTWMVDRGAYPATLRSEAEDINTVVDRIGEITTRYGSNSPLLIAPQWQLMRMLVRSAAAGEAVQPGQVVDLSAAVAEGMRRERAPVWLSKIPTSEIDLAKAGQAARENPDQLPKFYAALREMLLEMPFDVARYLILSQRNSQPELSDPVAEMIIALNGKMPGDLPAPDRHSWAIAVAEAQRTLGRDSQTKTTLQSAGIAPDLCLASDSDPKLLDQRFSYKDYPDDLIAGEQEGLSTFDFNLTSEGRVTSQRVILSFPANLFDAVSAKGLANVRYSEPKRNGRSVGCRGLAQPIVWRLEDNQEIDAFPLFSKGVLAPTT